MYPCVLPRGTLSSPFLLHRAGWRGASLVGTLGCLTEPSVLSPSSGLPSRSLLLLICRAAGLVP